MFDFNSLSPEELAVISLVIAVLMSENQDADKLNVLGNFIVSVGSLILTWAAQMQSQSNSNNQPDLITSDEFNNIKKKISSLEEKYRVIECRFNQIT